MLKANLVAILGILISPAVMADCGADKSVAAICLSGTTISPGYTAALVEEAGKPGLHAVHAGDMIDDWKVGEIAARYIVVVHDGQSIKLALTGAVTPVPVAAPPPQPPGIRKGPVVHTRSLARGQRD